LKQRDLNDVETYIDAAKQHGLDSEPDHETGDLQTLLRSAWSVLTIEQKAEIRKDSEVRDILDIGLGIVIDD